MIFYGLWIMIFGYDDRMETTKLRGNGHEFDYGFYYYIIWILLCFGELYFISYGHI